MVDETSKKETHADRVRQVRGRKSTLKLPPDAKSDWPANLGELLEWYSDEVTDISRATQLRMQEATRIVADCTKGEISLEEAAKRLNEYDDRWRQVFPGGVDQVRGMTDELRSGARLRAHRERMSRRVTCLASSTMASLGSMGPKPSRPDFR